MTRRQLETLTATVLVAIAVASLIYAFTKQFVIEGTSENNYLQWATRPLFILAAAALVTAIVAVILSALQRLRPLAVVAAAVSLALVGVGIANAVSRRHPLGHERSIFAEFQLPARDGAATTYMPVINNGLPGDVDPPSIVATWTVDASSFQACSDLAAAFPGVASHVRVPITIGPGNGRSVGGVACSYQGHNSGWPVMAEVDSPNPDADYEIPSRSGGIPAEPSKGLVRIDLYIQPPDGN